MITPLNATDDLLREIARLKEELARLKAPVEGEIAEVVARLHDASTKCDYHYSLDRKAAALLESLAARNAKLFERVAALTEERDWYSAANERAERAEAELAEFKKKCERLKLTLHEIKEEWAGAECGEPATAQEGYAIELCKRMYRIATEFKE